METQKDQPTIADNSIDSGIPTDAVMPTEFSKYQQASDKPKFTRPDRQTAFDDAEWPEVEQDTSTLYVDRVGESTREGPHRFTIKKGDFVRVWLGGNKFETGKAVALSPKRNTVKILWKTDTKPQWFSKVKIYPAFPSQQFGTGGKEETVFEAPMTGKTVCALMRANHLSIEQLAARLKVSQEQVRDVREKGLDDAKAVRDWVKAITGKDPEAAAKSEASSSSNGTKPAESAAKTDREAKQQEVLELAKSGIKELNEALQQGKSDTLVRYLDFLSRFHNYSLHNSMLIYTQRPDATHVAGFNRWKQMNRFVKKGEKGISIIAPMIRKQDEENETVIGSDQKQVQKLTGFRVAKVFDVSQTDGDELPEFTSLVGEPGDGLARLEALVREHGIDLEYDHLGSGTLGISTGGAITVKPDMKPPETFAVLVHEFAHELLHKGDRKNETTMKIRETEAEAVAYVVCRACGIDSKERSADYIQLYRGDTSVLEESLTFIQKTAAKIIAGLKPNEAAEAA